jgi:hypothetical protein
MFLAKQKLYFCGYRAGISCTNRRNFFGAGRRSLKLQTALKELVKTKHTLLLECGFISYIKYTGILFDRTPNISQ